MGNKKFIDLLKKEIRKLEISPEMDIEFLEIRKIKKQKLKKFGDYMVLLSYNKK